MILCDKNLSRLTETYTNCTAITGDVHYFHTPDYTIGTIQRLLDFIDETYHSSPDVLINYWPSARLPSLIDEDPVEQFSETLALMASI